MRKTKIIATIGPASADAKILRKLCLAGMNVARLNFSHGTHKQHQVLINMIKKVREELQMPIAIMLDTKGPEYRIKTFQNGSVKLQEGDLFTFTTRDVQGDQTCVSVSYANLMQDLEPGDTILLSNGLLVFTVEKVTKTDAVCRIVTGGVLSDQKSMNFPNKVLNQEYLSEQDKSDLLFGIRNDVDFVACSFVSRRQDLLDLSAFMHEHGGDDIDLIAKIENRSGVENIADICQSCEGIMIGRGDMGVEIPFEELPGIQKHLITSCRLLGKRVITATEMLESMIQNVRPTRAEISDVANAVFDGTSATMLSGETAAGKNPVLSVSTMARIAEQAELGMRYDRQFRTQEFTIKNTTDAVSHATCDMAMDIGAKAIVACTVSGQTARMVSRFRPVVPILGLATSPKTWRKLSLSWGVTPVMCPTYSSAEELIESAKELAKSTFLLKAGDRIVITGGRTDGRPGHTDMIKADIIE